MDTSETTNGRNGSPGAGGEIQGPSERNETGLTSIKEQRLIATALGKRWGGAKRWNTDATAQELEIRLRESNGQLTLKERTILAVMNGVTSNDQRVAGIAARNVLAMEAQNQQDELKQIPDMHLNIHKMADDEKKDRLAAIIEEAKAKAAKPAGGAEVNGTNGHVNGDGK